MYELLMRPFVRLQIAVLELREREDGQTTTEYAILLGFLAIAIIIALFFLRNVLRSLFSERGAQRLQRAELDAQHPSGYVRPAPPAGRTLAGDWFQ